MKSYRWKLHFTMAFKQSYLTRWDQGVFRKLKCLVKLTKQITIRTGTYLWISLFEIRIQVKIQLIHPTMHTRRHCYTCITAERSQKLPTLFITLCQHHIWPPRDRKTFSVLNHKKGLGSRRSLIWDDGYQYVRSFFIFTMKKQNIHGKKSIITWRKMPKSILHVPKVFPAHTHTWYHHTNLWTNQQEHEWREYRTCGENLHPHSSSDGSVFEFELEHFWKATKKRTTLYWELESTSILVKQPFSANLSLSDIQNSNNSHYLASW